MSDANKVTSDDFPVIFKLSKLAQQGYRQTSLTVDEQRSASRMFDTGYLSSLVMTGNRVTFRFIPGYQRKLEQNEANAEHKKAQNMLEKMNQERKSIARLELEGTKIDVPPTIEKTRAPRNDTPVSGDVASLIQQLKSTDDAAQKRKIRAKLRRMGHTGGAR